MDYKKLLGISTAVITLGAYTFNFSNFNSKDGLIKSGVDKIKAIAEQYRTDLETLQSEYDALLGELSNTENALEQARIKLQQIYLKITGQEWDEANGDILEYDFESLIKDDEQFSNNVDGDAIGAVLGLPAGCSTQDIIDAINDLISTVQSLEQRIIVLENQVSNLEAEIETYETEQDSLVEEINALKSKLDAATAEANAIIDGASQEEQAQLDYINNTLTELGGEAVEDTGEVTTPEVPEEPELTPYEEAYNNLSSNKLRYIVDAGYKPEYVEDKNMTIGIQSGYKILDDTFKNNLAGMYVVSNNYNTIFGLNITQDQKAELDAFYNEYMAQ